MTKVSLSLPEGQKSHIETAVNGQEQFVQLKTENNDKQEKCNDDNVRMDDNNDNDDNDDDDDDDDDDGSDSGGGQAK